MINRRTWGKWQLYPSKPATIGCKPYPNNTVYHIKLARLSIESERLAMLKHISEKPANYDFLGFHSAVEALVADGTIQQAR